MGRTINDKLTNLERLISDWCKERGLNFEFFKKNIIDGCVLAIHVKNNHHRYSTRFSITKNTNVLDIWRELFIDLEKAFAKYSDGLRTVNYTIDEIHDYRGTSGYNTFLSKRFNVPTPDPIKKVIFNPPATIVLWNDGTKTVVKCTDEEFDPEKGLAMAISKKLLGNKGNYYNEFKKWLPKVWTNDDINSIYPDPIKLGISAGASNFSKHVRQMLNNIYGFKTQWPAKNPYIKHEDEVVEYCKKDVEVTQKLYEDMMVEKHDKIEMKAARLRNIITIWCEDEGLNVLFRRFWKNPGCTILEVSSRKFGIIFITIKEVTKINKAFEYFCGEVDRKRKESPCED